MRTFSYAFLSVAATVLSCANAFPFAKPAAFFLAGDSTTAVQSLNGGGWGDGFLNTTLKNGAFGHNFGHNGATTVSFRAGGDWANVLAAVKNATASYTPWVTIQFGHNDQKPAANISLDQYSANLAQFVADVHTAGGTPILVTPLSRRSYSGDPERIVEDLADQREATLSVARQTSAVAIDLNQASIDYLNAIGSANAWTYNLNPTDHTHLNDFGSVVFGNMMSWLMEQSAVGLVLRQSTVANKTMVKDFKKGIFISA